MGRCRTTRFLLVAIVFLASEPASGGLGCDDGVVYVLTEDSAWLEGCIVGLCRCPVALLDDLTGDLVLVELPTLQPGPWRLFEVCDVQWTLGRGKSLVEIRGSGFYHTAAPVLDEHRLVLDLQLDGDPIGTLDSGVVAGALFFPEIEIQALTSGECFQEGAQLAAAPIPEPSQGLQQLAGLLALWGLSRWRPRRHAAEVCVWPQKGSTDISGWRAGAHSAASPSRIRPSKKSRKSRLYPSSSGSPSSWSSSFRPRPS